MKTNLAILVLIVVLAVGAVRFKIPSRWFEPRVVLAKVKGDFPSISSALKTYKINAGHYPSTEQGLQALVERPTIPPLPEDWVQIFDKVRTDPWRRDYQYRLLGEAPHDRFELRSLGHDGIDGTKDDQSSLDP